MFGAKHKYYCSIRFQIQASTLAKSSLIETAFNRQFEQQPSAIIARWSFPKLYTDHQLDRSLSHTMFKQHFTRPTEYVFTNSSHLSARSPSFRFCFLSSWSWVARSDLPEIYYIWLRVAFVCSIPHRARRLAYYLVICMICLWFPLV